MQVGEIFFYTALKFSPNHPYATANFALSNIKFAVNWHKRPRRNKSILFQSSLPIFEKPKPVSNAGVFCFA